MISRYKFLINLRAINERGLLSFYGRKHIITQKVCILCDESINRI